MTNSDLEQALNKFLQEGTADKQSIAMLMDASIHLAIKQGMPLQEVSGAYIAMAALHEVMVLLDDLETAVEVLAKDQAEPKPKSVDKDKESINALLKDLKIDL